MAYTLRNVYRGSYQGWKENGNSQKEAYRSVFATIARTVNYYERRIKGEFLDPTPYTRSESTATGTNGNETLFLVNTGNTVTAPKTAFRHFGDYSFINYSSILTPLRASITSEINSKLINGLNESPISLGVALAEARETCGLVGLTAVRIASSLRALRKGKVGTALSLLDGNNYDNVRKVKRKLNSFSDPAKAVSAAWLEAQFGWGPMLSDVYGAAQAAGEGLQKRNDDIGLSATAARQTSKYTQNALYRHRAVRNSDGNFLRWQKYAAGQRSDSYQLHYSERQQHYWTVVNPAFRNMQALGLLNPLSVAWELVPLSFVIDWFYPVGNWLNGMTATAGLTYKSGFATIKEKGYKHASTSGAFYEQTPGGNYNTYTGSAQFSINVFRRSLNVAIPSNEPPRPRGLFDAMNGGKLLTSLALAKQLSS
jgi:hypothetical protein